MKNKKIIVLLIVINIILIGIICSFISGNRNVIKEKQVIKEMSESTQTTDLNNQINALNAEHTQYVNYIQTCKTKIATALTNEGVTTSNQETLETMAENISKVLEARTSNATATAEDIVDGKTAYVNGELVTGIMSSNGKYAYTTSSSVTIEKDGYFFATVVDYWWNYTSSVYMSNSRAGTISHIGRYTGEVYDKNDNLQQWTTYTFFGEVKAGDTISVNGCKLNYLTRICYPI